MRVQPGNCCSWAPPVYEPPNVAHLLGGYATERQQYAMVRGGRILDQVFDLTPDVVAPNVPAPVETTRRVPTTGHVSAFQKAIDPGRAHVWDSRFEAILKGGPLDKAGMLQAMSAYSLMADRYLEREIYRARRRGIVNMTGGLYELAR